MCSQELDAGLVIAWPTAEIEFMGPAGAANIIFRTVPDVEAKTAEYIDNFATPYQAAKRGMVDIVIQPKDSRPTIINALQMLDSKRESRPAKKHGNIPLSCIERGNRNGIFWIIWRQQKEKRSS